MLFHHTLLTLCTMALAAATPLLRLYHFGAPGKTTPTPPRHESIAVHDKATSLSPPHETIRARDSLEEHGKIGGIYMCTGINFTGDCKYTQLVMGTCYGLPPPLKSNIASFAPDQAFGGSMPDFAFGCRLYEDEACSAGNVRFEYPGVSSGKLWVNPRSVKCEFYNPTAMNLYTWLRPKSRVDKGTAMSKNKR